MKIVFSHKCCRFLQLPPTAPHTSAHTPPQPQTDSPPVAPLLPPDDTAAPPTAAAPLLQEKKKMEEEQSFLLFTEEKTEPALKAALEELTSGEYSKNWPTLMKVGFDFPAFKNAINKAPDKQMVFETWRQSLDYAEFAWRAPHTVKDTKGELVRSAHVWIAGCFKKNSHYPRPANYQTPEEIAQEKAKQAALKAQVEQEEERFLAAFEKWRGQYTASELRELAGWKFGTEPPEPVLRNKFRELFGPEGKPRHLEQGFSKQATASDNPTADSAVFTQNVL